MKKYIKKEVIVEINTVTPETEVFITPNEEGIYYIDGKPINEKELCDKLNIVRNKNNFNYKSPILFTKVFTKVFETEAEMNIFIETNFSDFMAF
jgi:hypothetical protein